MRVVAKILSIAAMCTMLISTVASAQASTQAQQQPGDCFTCKYDPGQDTFRCDFNFNGFGFCDANWWGCEASGRCTTVFGMVGADGSIIPGSETTLPEALAVEVGALREAEPGKWYRVNCSGIILDRKFAALSSSQVRLETKTIVL